MALLPAELEPRVAQAAYLVRPAVLQLHLGQRLDRRARARERAKLLHSLLDSGNKC